MTCEAENLNKYQLCQVCGKRKPKRRQPAHTVALKKSYEEFVALNGGKETCGICDAPKTVDGPRLHRDHDHRTGAPRGLLCFPCNSALRPYMTLDWLRRAVAYAERAEEHER